MAEPVIFYDEPADTLYISFAPGERAAGVSLNDHILLRVNPDERRAIGITLLDFSLLINRSDIAPRRFPLTGLDELPAELRELAMELLRSPPVSDYLTLSADSPAGAETVPITMLNADKLVARAA